MLFPKDFPIGGVDAVDIIGGSGFDRDFLGAIPGGNIADDHWRKQVVHLTRFVVELGGPANGQSFHVVFSEDGFVALPTGALRVAAIGEPVGGWGRGGEGRAADHCCDSSDEINSHDEEVS